MEEQNLNSETQSTTQQVSSLVSPEQNTPKPKRKSYILTILLGIIFLGVIFYTASRYFTPAKPVVQQNTTPTAKLQTIPQTEAIKWLPKPEKTASVGFFSLIDAHYPYKLLYVKADNNYDYVTHSYEPNAEYYQVGTYTNGKYKGGTIYLGIVKNLPYGHINKGIPGLKDIVNDLTNAYIFIKLPDNSFVITNDYENRDLICSGDTCDKKDLFVTGKEKLTGITIDTKTSIDHIGSGHDDYTDSVTKYTYTVTRSNKFFDSTGLYEVKELGNNSILYSNQNLKSNPLKLKAVINPTMFIKLSTGLTAEFFSGPYSNGLLFQKKADSYVPFSSVSYIGWSGPDKPELLPQTASDSAAPLIPADFGLGYTTDFDGCSGNLTLEKSADDLETVNVQDNLVQVATTDKGDILYDLKDKNYKIFNQFWLAKVNNNGKYSLNYAEYLALKPILIEKDKWGLYHMIFRTDLVDSKCFAEPLIYLYPPKKTNVTVNLSKNINLTESEPAYNSGWNVTAYPDGKLYDQAKQRSYPYLYWEGSASEPKSPIYRDIIATKDLHAYFETKLNKLGLNTKERGDFEKFWEPQFKSSPYYQITLYDASAINKVAPLSLSPQPDTLIRVLMSYEGLKEKTEFGIVLDKPYSTPTRNGFTAVEWGGILHK
jgi:hypothetical protein